MPDYYHIPALVLSALFLPAFGYLYLRFRDARTLLWFLGFVFALISMAAMYLEGPLNFALNAHPWLMAAGQSAMQISSALFFASLSPVRFSLGKLKIPFVVPYAVPLVVAPILFFGYLHGVAPAEPGFLVFPALGQFR